MFISFALGGPPRGSHSYASDLARRLRELDFSVFFSEDEAPPGDELDKTLRRALARSRILVVIANRGTLADPRWVRAEVEEFRRRHPTRPVIPISVGGAVLDPDLGSAADAWLGFKDKIWIDESEAAAGEGVATSEVVARLATAPRSVRANARWRWLVRAAIALLAGLAALLAWQTKLARDAEARALDELRRVVSLRLLTDSQAMLSGARKGSEERALLQLVAADRIAPAVAAENSLLESLLRLARLRKLTDGEQQVESVAFSPDSSRFVSAGGDGTLRLWDTQTGRPTGDPIKAHERSITRVAFSGDGGRIVSASTDATLRLWDAHTHLPIGPPLTGHADPVSSVAFSPNGERIVSGGGGNPSADAGDRHSGRPPARRDYSLRLWDARTSRAIGAPLEGHRGAVLDLAFSPDGNRIVSASGDHTVRLWDGRAGRPAGLALQGLESVPTSVAFSPDARQVAFGTDAGTLYLWDLADRRPAAVLLDRHDGPVLTVGFSADGKRIVSRARDGRVWEWDATTRKTIELQPEALGASVMAFSPDGKHVVSGWGLEMRLWTLDAARSIGTPLPEDRGVAVAFNSDGSRIVSGGSDGAVRLWDARTGHSINALPGADGRKIIGAGSSHDGKGFVFVDVDGTVRDWDGQVVRTIVAPPKESERKLIKAAFNRDGSRLVTADDKGTLQIWDTTTGRPWGTPIEASRGVVFGLAFSPDGALIASCGNDREPRMWRADTGKPVGHVEPGADCMSIAFSADGHRFVTGGSGGKPRMWSAKTGMPVGAPLEELKQGVLMSIAFGADGKRILAGTNHGSLQVWDTATGQLAVTPLEGHHGIVRSLAVSADGERVVSASGDTVLLWPGPKVWADRLCDKLSRNLSRNQWREWVSQEIAYTCQCPDLPIAADEAELPGSPQTCSAALALR